MRKKIIIGFLTFMMIAGTAYAAGKSVSVYVNGKQVQSGTVIDGQTMLPLRAVAEALGATVDWDGKTYSARITKPQEAQQEPEQRVKLDQISDMMDSVAMVTGDFPTKTTQGSGFIIDGVLVTNAHVAANATSIEIVIGGKTITKYPPDVLFQDEQKDVMGIRMEGYKSLKYTTNSPTKGDSVISIGFPQGKFRMTEGDVFHFNPDAQENIIYHTAPTYRGSSGGVLLNNTGEVIGITTTGSDSGDVGTARSIKDVIQKLK